MKEKIIIWGTGRMPAAYRLYIEMQHVICFVDSDPEKIGSMFLGKKVISPGMLGETAFDKLIIFTSVKYDEIYAYAVNELGISCGKIWYWSNYYLYDSPVEALDQMQRECGRENIVTAVDYGLHFRGQLCGDETLEWYGYNADGARLYPVYLNMYRAVYKELEDIPLFAYDGAVYLGRIDSIDAWENCRKRLAWARNEFTHIFLSVPYPDTAVNREIYDEIQRVEGEKREWKLNFARLIHIRYSRAKIIKVFVAAHKAGPLFLPEAYDPLWLGRTEDNIWGYQEDKEPPSISALNRFLNECTGMYWMWKHAVCDYIGLVHYRRYFVRKSQGGREDILSRGDIAALLNDRDIILAQRLHMVVTIEEQLKITVEAGAFYQGMNLIREIIGNRCPEYTEAFNAVMEGRTMFPYNMMITRKDVFDRYCEWLFGIIIEAAERLEASGYEGYSQRMIGFLAERLLTVWIMRQSLRIVEKPVWTVGEIVDTNTDISRRHRAVE